MAGGGAAHDLQPNSAQHFLPQCSRYKQQQSQGWTPPTFSVMSAVMVSWISDQQQLVHVWKIRFGMSLLQFASDDVKKLLHLGGED